MSTKLFVGNLSFNTTENDLQDAFAAHGTVVETNLMVDRMSGRPRGFGFVTMSTPEEAQKAIDALNGASLDGRAVTVNAPLGGTVTTNGVTKLTGTMTIGNNLVLQDGVVLLGGPSAGYTVGDNVNVGSYAVVARSSVGTGATIGARSVVLDSTVAAGQVVPPGSILINNKVVGQVGW